MTVSTYSILASFENTLQKKPRDFEIKRKLYCLAAVVSGLAAAIFFTLSLFAFQITTAPFWLGLAGPVVMYFTGYLLGKAAFSMIEKVKEIDRVIHSLKEIQNNYRQDEGSLLPRHEKTLRAHGLHAEKEYLALQQTLLDLQQNTNASNLDLIIEEIITVEHQTLISKVNLAFIAAIYDAKDSEVVHQITHQRDILEISDQDPLLINRIQGLNNFLEGFSLPLVSFRNNSSQNLFYNQVRAMSVEDLTQHIFTALHN